MMDYAGRPHMIHACDEGRRLRARALATAVRIRSQAWMDAGAVMRREMLAQARAASDAEYARAFDAWRSHYRRCLVCQEALRP